MTTEELSQLRATVEQAFISARKGTRVEHLMWTYWPLIESALTEEREKLRQLREWLKQQTDSMCEKRRFDVLGSVLAKLDAMEGTDGR